MQLVYARDPANAHGLIAYDWTGARRGSTKFPTWVPIASLRPTPDGSAFFIDPASPGDYAAYFDRTGRILFETNEEGFMSQVWADDSAHVCVFESNPGAVIITRIPGQAVRAAPTLVDGSFSLEACSVRSDTAAFVSSDEIVVTKLSTGAELWRASLQGQLAVVSGDTAYVATAVGVFKRGDLGRTVAQLGPNLTPLAFSGDDSLLLVGQADGGGPLEAINVKSGRVAWRYGAGTANVELVLTHPSAPDFAIYVGAELVIVHADGRSVQIG